MTALYSYVHVISVVPLPGNRVAMIDGVVGIGHVSPTLVMELRQRVMECGLVQVGCVDASSISDRFPFFTLSDVGSRLGTYLCLRERRE